MNALIARIQSYADRKRYEAAVRDLHRMTTERATSPEIIAYRQNRAASKLGWARKRGRAA